jgi:hypothetical protein
MSNKSKRNEAQFETEVESVQGDLDESAYDKPLISPESEQVQTAVNGGLSNIKISANDNNSSQKVGVTIKTENVTITITEEKCKNVEDSKDRYSADIYSTELDTLFETTNTPDTPEKCKVWRYQIVRRKIIQAVAYWAQEPFSSILPNNTLGELAKGTPWGMAQQLQLVSITNQHNVFDPFKSKMPNPSLQPSTTTVAQWEAIVWGTQKPETFCFHLV